jgi:hypothetical protein
MRATAADRDNRRQRPPARRGQPARRHFQPTRSNSSVSALSFSAHARPVRPLQSSARFIPSGVSAARKVDGRAETRGVAQEVGSAARSSRSGVLDALQRGGAGDVRPREPEPRHRRYILLGPVIRASRVSTELLSLADFGLDCVPDRHGEIRSITFLIARLPVGEVTLISVR